MPNENVFKPKVRVAFDTSVLGYAQYGAGGRTGVFRMADALARALTKEPECELAFCGAENFQMWTHAREYLRQDKELSHVPVLSYGSAARVYHFLGKPFWELVQSRQSGLPAKAVRRVLGQVLRSVDTRYAPLQVQALEGRDIFHSLFYGLPEQTRGVRGLRRFLSVCDLINIRFPQYSRDQGAFLKSIFATVHPSDRVIAISECTRADFLEYRKDISVDHVTAIPLAASPAFKRVQMERPERPYFLSVCTLDPRKNIEGLVRAFAHWVQQQRNNETDLVLCGALGESAEKIRETVRQVGLTQARVKLTGYVPDASLAPLYSGATAFVYTSFYEGFGLPVLEAMQCGTPVITSNTSALKEIAEGAAILVDPNRSDEIAAALDTVYRDGLVRAQMTQWGLERAEKFSWERSAKKLLETYRESL